MFCLSAISVLNLSFASCSRAQMLSPSFPGPSFSDEEESVLSKATLIAGGIVEFVHNLCGQKKKKKKKKGYGITMCGYACLIDSIVLGNLRL